MKYKILHLIHHISGTADGSFNHLLMLLKNTDKKKYEHMVFVENVEKAIQKLEKLSLTLFIDKSIKNKIPILTWIKIYKIIKKYEIDLIQTHSTKTYILFGLLNIFLRKKHLFNYHGTFIFNRYYNIIEKVILYLLHFVVYFFNGCQMVIAPSELSLKNLKSESKMFRAFNFYYNSAVDDDLKEPDNNIDKILENLKNKYFLVGVISRFEYFKRIDLVMKLILLFKSKNINDIYFVFMGDGPQFYEMKILAKNLNLDDRLTLLGYVPDANLYFKHFKLLLLTSESEGFPLIIWEAMKEGIPVVASDVGGIKEILEKENCGLVYKLGDLDNCFDLIMLIKKNEKLWFEFSQNGKNGFIKYGKERFISDFEGIYKSLLTK